MKASIVKIGNSRGIRIPKPVCEQCGFEDEVELEVHNNELVIRSSHKAREGWGDTFQAMAKQGDDVLLDGETVSTSAWDNEEWEWKK